MISLEGNDGLKPGAVASRLCGPGYDTTDDVTGNEALMYNTMYQSSATLSHT